jgi:oligoribonuclease NrnB/cAMP/cGMP phosphodiesterase (DHH superfamily)
MIRVWYHAHCNDGLAAAAVAYLVFGDSAVYTAVEYGKEHPPYVEGDDIVIVDFSYPYHVLKDVRAGSMIVLDHHKTAREELEQRSWPENWNVLFDMTRSGAMMAWDYWFPNEATPKFVELIQDRDLWKFEFSETNSLHAGLELSERSVKAWATLIRGNFDKYVEAGQIIEKVKLKQMDQMLETMIEWQTISGFRVPAVNTSLHMSDLGNRLCQLYPDAPFSAIWFTQSDGSRKYSLRSLGFDVSEVAKKFGGGGHPKAAGFIWTIDYAREVAARVWCEPETSDIIMDTRLAEAFAQALITKKL